MKNAKIFTVAVLVASSLFAASSVFAASCDVKVTLPDGGTLKGIKISGLTSGMAGVVLNNVYTDSSGRATLSWGGDSYSSLKTVFVNGEDQQTSCSNGSSVSFVVKP
ncbi:MAG: hypothetical protein NTX45_18715 [Proteobacteria bacterium]|nr:hypothetical protein [Pseudomonadota bacterium]